MMGGDLTKLDDATLALLTNDELPWRSIKNSRHEPRAVQSRWVDCLDRQRAGYDGQISRVV